MRPDIRHRGSSVSSRGIVVRSEYPIDLFGSNEEKFSHDCFLTLPTALLGMEYYTVHSSPSTLQQQFAITPAENDTEVTVQLSSTLEGKVEFNRKDYYAGDIVEFTLSIGDSAQVQTKDTPALGLSGTRVRSNKPIALFSGNVRTSISLDGPTQHSRDHLVEQLLPYPRWRNQYYAPSSPMRLYEDIFLFLSKESTRLEIENEAGEIVVHSLKAVESKAIRLDSGDSHHYVFTAEKPFQVVRLTASQIKGNTSLTDPAMLLLLHTDYWKYRYTFALPVFTGGSHGGNYQNVIQIVVEKEKRAGIQMNDRVIKSSWNIFGSTNYATTNIQLEHTRQVTLHHKDNALFMVYLYGAADKESYAMPCGITLRSWL
ncbi:IgGFc-binding protein-like [Watersipora subatra]|uniref:IgGFc-binding protein-like n=1 Tax=Watersipora subatra TaxID=2589382 RepID=UPI00355BAB5A